MRNSLSEGEGVQHYRDGDKPIKIPNTTKKDYRQLFELGQMMMSRWLIIGLVQAVVLSISITVSSQRERCMIVSSNNQEHFLKVDLKFQRFAEQAIQQGYRVVLHNTQTHEEQAYQVYEGSFRREFKLTENVVYRLCFKIVLSSFRKISKLIEYNAGAKHKFTAAGSHIAVPSKLLKTKDLTDTYTSLNTIKQLTDRVKEQDQSISKDQDKIFTEQKLHMEHSEWIIVAECLLICFFGGFQFYKLRRIIQNKQSF